MLNTQYISTSKTNTHIMYMYYSYICSMTEIYIHDINSVKKKPFKTRVNTQKWLCSLSKCLFLPHFLQCASVGTCFSTTTLILCRCAGTAVLPMSIFFTQLQQNFVSRSATKIQLLHPSRNCQTPFYSRLGWPVTSSHRIVTLDVETWGLA